MRKPPPLDADPSGRPTGPDSEPLRSAEAPEPDPATTEPSTAPSLVWPPVEDEINEWEVLQLHSTGNTIIEPLKFTPAAAPGAAALSGSDRPAFTPPTPAPYVPPSPIDDPVGEATLIAAISSDFDLPETELIEPLHAPTTATIPIALPLSGARPAAVPTPSPDAGDDRTVVIPRPTLLTPPASRPESSRTDSGDETNAGQATRILIAPNFAATVGHAPTVPVSALHRSATSPWSDAVRSSDAVRPMEDTLPAGVTRELLARGFGADDATAIQPSPTADTHPVTAASSRAHVAPASPPGPFSRVVSRGPQPVVAPGTSPVSAAPPPLALAPPPGPAPAVPTQPRITPPSTGARSDEVPARVTPPSTRTQLTWLGIGVAALLVIGVGLYQYLSMRDTAAAAPAPATLSIDSTPAGAAVAIDGAPRGKTPLRLELSEGAHALDVTSGGSTKHIPLTLVAGTVTAHTLEFAVTPAAAAIADSAIEIRSEPQGGRVLVDGVARGVTPIVVTGLTAGRHDVQVSGPFRTVTRAVNVAAGQQVRLVVTPARTETPETSGTPKPTRGSAETGYVTIQSPIVLRVVRNGDFVGTSEDGRLSLPAGSQVIGLENESVGFRDVRTIDVAGGKVTVVPVTLPNGSISINARPWAEVFVDGQRVGETPVSQYSLPIGIHEILFRHPDQGERKVSVVVKIGATGRAFTDFTK
jgi:hypothetical protein